MTIVLNERGRSILDTIIQDYIETAEPVGSRSVSKKSHLRLSPATIRNIMADLEDMGLISQPHISAGRVPTETGLRFYVNSILELRPWPRSKRGGSKATPEDSGQEVDELLKTTLEDAGRPLPNRRPRFPNRNLPRPFLNISNLSLLRDTLLLVVLVTQAGLVQNKLIEIEESLSQSELDHLTRIT